MFKKETVHVSLGSTSNAVTAHLLNLQGLAATADNDLCDANVTHGVSNQCYVPRVLIVDEPHRFKYQSTSRVSLPAESNVSTWDGTVEVQQPQETPTQEPGVASFVHDAASRLAYSTYSRYRAPSSMEQSSIAVNSTSNGRHMVWDDEEEEEEEEDEQEKLDRQNRERRRWFNETAGPLQQEMEDSWSRQQQHVELSWMDYWMPPLPSTHSYAAPLPFTQPSGGVVDTWDSFTNGISNGGNNMTAWREDALFDRFRRILEVCDGVQGVAVVTEGWGIHAGLATAMLQEMQEEVRSAGRFVVHMTEPYETITKQDEKEQAKESAWQPAHVQRVRRNLQTGLAFQGLTTNAHVVLPLSLDSLSSHATLFAKSAIVAMALETATVSYRLTGSSSSSSSIGLNGYYDGSGRSWSDPYGTAGRLSFGEFLAYLRPSAQHNILEMDTYQAKSEPHVLLQSLQRGTSIERERLMRSGGRDASSRRPRDVPPGKWMQHFGHTGGILRSLSPGSKMSTDRELHRHFALSSSFRPQENKTTISTHLTSFMESMGIRYRPEASMGTVVGQSIHSLTEGGYGAGSYWKTLLGRDELPVISVIGNTTRVYGHLDSVATKMKDSLSHKYSGYRSRDVATGVLPENEDCDEALEHCFDVRDAYHPPEGSGLVAHVELDLD